MADIKDFKNGNKKTEVDVEINAGAKNKRRPGRDAEMSAAPAEDVSEADVKVVDVESEIVSEPVPTETIAAKTTTEPKAEPSESAHYQEQQESGDKIEINFPGSELLRARFPKSFQVADAVATDWINDGKFEKIPLENPAAQMLASRGLQTAKEIEKKVMASPVTEKLMLEALQAGMKVMAHVEEIKSKFNRK